MRRAETNLGARWPALIPKEKPVLPIAPRPDRTAVVLGRDNNGRPVSIPLRARQEHLLVLGATGSGKSSMLLHYMRQSLMHGEGLAFLDPHGNAFRDLLNILAGTHRRIHVVDFSAPFAVGFNPLACPEDTDPSVIVGNVIDALSVSWDGESLSEKPTIERVLKAVLGALVELRLTLCEARYILEHDDAHGLRQYAIQHVSDTYTREQLKRLDDLSRDSRRKRDFDQETVGPENRLARLFSPPTVRAMLGQTENCIDLKEIMDNGEVLLANLSGGTKVYNRDTDLFGRLLTRSVMFHAERRANKNPFTLVMDEAHRYLSSDIPTLLAEVRKRGVSIVAAIQWLEQARTYDENILAALLNSTNCKISFRLRDAEEAEKIARTMIPVDLEQPVAALIKPAVIGHRRTLLNNENVSEQQSKINNWSVALGETESVGGTRTQGVSRNHSVTNTASDSHSSASITSKSDGSIIGEGTSAAEVMIPTDDPSEPIISRKTAGASSSHSKSSASSTGKVQGNTTGNSRAATDGITESESNAITKGFAQSKVVTEGEGKTVGTGRSTGRSEALEPIMEDRPTAVYSLTDQLYKAGQLLRSLPTAVGYLSYVGQKGPVSTLFTVPLIGIPRSTDAAFVALRNRFLGNCSSITEALTIIAGRAEMMTVAPTPAPKPPSRPPVTPKSNPQDDHSEPGIY